MTIKILIVDDEEFICEEVSETLIEEGYQCLTASNVDDALTIIRNNHDISLIVTDLKMPRKSGVDLIKIVENEFGKTFKFVVMSGHGSALVDEIDIDLNAYSFLKKPLDIDKLIETVSLVLEKEDDHKGSYC
jgi:DNA-binding NtrC family response regulator